LDRRRWDIHGVYVPEAELDIEAEASRLRTTMDDIGCVNLFISEGAGVESIVAELEAAGADIPRDPFGHVMLDKVNPGAWFGKQFAERLGAEKVMIQKSGYFSRSAAANAQDLELIRLCVEHAVDCALRGEGGVVGHDEDHDDELRAIEFDRIKGGKRFDPTVDWFTELLADIGQPSG
jgi:pyrophosphate--fructose-6-phosphate 1-phosphotransferase